MLRVKTVKRNNGINKHADLAMKWAWEDFYIWINVLVLYIFAFLFIMSSILFCYFVVSISFDLLNDVIDRFIEKRIEIPICQAQANQSENENPVSKMKLVDDEKFLEYKNM